MKMQRFSGAVASRVVDASFGSVVEHAHDQPLLSLYMLGSYTSVSEAGDVHIDTPSAVYYAAGEAHANWIGAFGFEQIEIEFDPAWLRASLPRVPVTRWIGGRMAAAARRLAQLWLLPDVGEAALRAATGEFFGAASHLSDPPRPRWLEYVCRRLREEPNVSISTVAREVGLSPGWLAEAYRSTTGEGWQETACRHRVELATRMLRESASSAADAAAAAGFCDQSHMIRCFRRVLGCTPGDVTQNRGAMRTLPSMSPS